MTPRDIASLFALGAMWGASFLFLRIAAPALNPLPTSELRVLIAGLVLLAVAVVRSVPFDLRVRWRSYLVLGTINAALPFALIAAATTVLPASFASILNSTTPMFAAVAAWIWLGEPIGMRRGAGIGVGLGGVALLVGWNPIGFGTPVLLASAAMLGGAFCYGIGGIYASRAFLGAHPIALATAQQFAAGLVLLPLALATPPSEAPNGRVIVALLGLAVISTSIAYLIYFSLIRRVGPFRTVMVTYLVPGFGVLWGTLLLDEEITLAMWIGLAIILLSVALLSGVRLPAAVSGRFLAARRRGTVGSD